MSPQSRDKSAGMAFMTTDQNVLHVKQEERNIQTQHNWHVPFFLFLKKWSQQQLSVKTLYSFAKATPYFKCKLDHVFFPYLTCTVSLLLIIQQIDNGFCSDLQ